MNLGFQEMLFIFVIVLLLFGAKRLPEIGRALGQAWREFNTSLKGEPKDSSGEKRGD